MAFLSDDKTFTAKAPTFTFPFDKTTETETYDRFIVCDVRIRNRIKRAPRSNEPRGRRNKNEDHTTNARAATLSGSETFYGIRIRML